MRGTLLVIVTVALGIVACGDGAGQTAPLLRKPNEASNKTGEKKSDDPSSETPAPGDGENVPAPTTPTPEADGDADGIPDAKDCAPQDANIAGTKLLDEMLTTDRSQFAAASGFPAASWSYGTAYMQTRLVDAADATFFAGDTQLANVDVEVRAASTEVTTIAPRLRQMFILLGATSENGTLTAYGCGLEVVQGLAPEQRTSVVKLSGSANAVTTTAIDRTARTIVKAGEDFTIRARVKDGAITCTASQGVDAVTTAQANAPDLRGAVGFFTRQTKAAFKSVKICKLK